MNLFLYRIEGGDPLDSNETIGVLLIEDKIFSYTLELPYRNNRRNISCIPLGKYSCQKVSSPKYGNTIEVMEVPDRSDILFHSGNTYDDTKGCIILGKTVGSLNNKRAVLSSRDANIEFMRYINEKNPSYITLYIKSLLSLELVEDNVKTFIEKIKDLT